MFTKILRLVVVLFALAIALVTPPASATTWQAVAQSEDGQQLQYVDVESIEQVGAIRRLKSYWLDKQRPDSQTYAVTEYHCDRQQYRDLELNGQAQTSDWQSIQNDRLNQAVMDYACHPSTAFN